MTDDEIELRAVYRRSTNSMAVTVDGVELNVSQFRTEHPMPKKAGTMNWSAAIEPAPLPRLVLMIDLDRNVGANFDEASLVYRTNGANEYTLISKAELERLRRHDTP